MLAELTGGVQAAAGVVQVGLAERVQPGVFGGAQVVQGRGGLEGRVGLAESRQRRGQLRAGRPGESGRFFLS
jgi:hypothetical protein